MSFKLIDVLLPVVKYSVFSVKRDGEANIEAFLMHLAVDANVAPSTQNKAMNALVFRYKHVLKQPMDKEINTVRASRKIKVPVVMTREEVARIIAFIEGIPQLIVKMLFSAKAIQFFLRKALQKAGITKHVTVHTLGHSFGTHLLEKGYNIRTIQGLLGHQNLQTTMIFTHVAEENKFGVRSPLDRR